MFENLVESVKSKRTKKRRVKFLLVTSIAWILLAATISTIGLHTYEAKLEDDYKLLTHLSPTLKQPPLPPPPGPVHGQAPSAGPKSTRAERTSKERLALVAKTTPPVIAVRKAPRKIEIPKQSEVARRGQASNQPDLPAPLPNSRSGIDMGGGIEGGGPGGTIGGRLGGSANGVFGGTGTAAAPPPPPSPVPSPTPSMNVEEPRPQPRIVRRSEGAIRGNAIVKPIPDYPAPARSAGIQGDIQVEITVSEDGNVINARAVNGHALLKQAALTAVRQWKFKPTVINNTPVKVEGVITFKFML